MRINKLYGMGLMVFLLFVASSCIPTGELQEDSRKVDLEGAQSVEVKIEFGAGEIEVSGGAEGLMAGVFQYNVEQWRPEVDYRVRDNRGFLSVRQGNSSGIPAGNGKNLWDIYLNEQIPVDLIIDMGAGEGDLNLQHINLISLDLDMGVGELNVDLSGKYLHDVNVSIDGGVGSTTLFLPRDIGVMVKASKGLGSMSSKGFIKKGDTLVNEAYGKTDVEINVKIDTGIGSITLKLM